MSKVFFVGAGPGDPGLITVKGMELLKGAEVMVYTGSLVNPELVAMSPAAVKLNSWGMSLEETGDAIETAVKQGKKVVRLHSGDPSIFGSIVEQIDDLAKRNIEVEVVPGVSSMFAAAAALQTQLTLKGVAETVIITRPAGETLETDEIPELAKPGRSLVVFLGTGHLEAVMNRVSYPQDTPAAVVYHASWPDQKILKGTVADIAAKAKAAGIDKTALILVGGIVEPFSRYHRSVLYS